MCVMFLTPMLSCCVSFRLFERTFQLIPTPEIEDLLSVIKPVLRHRIIPNFNAEAEGLKSDSIIDELLKIN